MIGRVTIVYSSGNFAIWCEQTKLSYLCRQSDLAGAFNAHTGQQVEFDLATGSTAQVARVKHRAETGSTGYAGHATWQPAMMLPNRC